MGQACKSEPHHVVNSLSSGLGKGRAFDWIWVPNCCLRSSDYLSGNVVITMTNDRLYITLGWFGEDMDCIVSILDAVVINVFTISMGARH